MNQRKYNFIGAAACKCRT